ncbi:hypothetical protein [Massilia pseudoviolaceinigra]|uniref:hypothetical protein n=1 Tax=Massilia pseudoviolaceinigra TaxID=3057165 RepID=UPI002796B502|nr:hypothetical protein [Massilia sp. CCM 9206]MDQ1924267.1 hypothetical protein [Massilia sp. CCM 9206]
MKTLILAKIVALLSLFVCCSLSYAGTPAPQRLHRFIAKTDAISTSGKPTAERAKLVHAEYMKNFAADAAAIRDDELAEFFEATQHMMFYTLDKSQLPSFERMFARLVDTGKATSEQYGQLLQIYYALREFEKANAFLKRYGQKRSSRETIEINDLTSPSAPRTGWVLGDNRRLTRLDLDLNSGRHLVIIVSPYCHFAIKALSAIESDSTLAPLLRQKVTVMVMQDFNFFYDKYARWNQVHLLLPLVLTHSREEWPEVSHWVSPLFLFFRDGKLESKFSGWPSDENVDKVYKGLGITFSSAKAITQE